MSSRSFPEQLSLRVGLREGVTFENFLEQGNEALIHQLRSRGEPFIYLWGGHGSGRSHLLQALCHESDSEGEPAVYLSLHAYQQLDVTMLEGLEQYSLIAIDDIDAVAGEMAWEEALFHLYNRIREERRHLVVAASSTPTATGFLLPDLVSRLGWGPVYQVQPLNDRGKAAALQLRSRRRGMELPDDVAAYLLKQAPRDPALLFNLLDELDRASLSAKRRLTIPFVRDILAQTSLSSSLRD